MTGGRTYLTQVTAPESRPPSERPRASLYSGPWARWPVGTPQVVQVVSSISPGARSTLHPPPPPSWSPHQLVLGSLPDPADVVHVLELHSRGHCRQGRGCHRYPAPRWGCTLLLQGSWAEARICTHRWTPSRVGVPPSPAPHQPIRLPAMAVPAIE